MLISGEEIRGYTASEPIDRLDPVEISGDYEVSVSGGDAFAGVALYTVASGQEMALAGDDCEVRVEAGEEIEAGDSITVDAEGDFVVATDRADQIGVANTGAGAGELVEIYLTDNLGNLGA